MPTPLSSLLPQIVTLNVPDQPFSFFAQGRQIIGWWDIAKITSLYPTQATHVDEDYRLTVTQPTVGYDPAVYSFESSRIKDPLFTWLQSDGWRHKGFLGQLFAR